MRGRCQGIWRAVPDIPSAIAIEIHRMGVVGGRNELGLAHGAGPRAAHGFRLDVAVLDDLQSGDQLVLGELGAAPLVGQGGQ
ncbi:hypothetical protein D3C76_1717880 [compost metagenome]